MTDLAAGRLDDLRSSHPAAARRLLGAVDAALEAAAPDRLVREALSRSEGGVLVGGEPIPAEGAVVLAFGKAALGMSRGAGQVLGSFISRGLVVTDEAGDAPEWAELIVSGHPIPDRHSVRAAHAAIALAEGMGRGEMLLSLASGGGSALMEAPAAGLTLDDLQDLNDRLIRSGAPIGAINEVRRAVSKVKGGRLAAGCRGRVVTLIVSDAGRDPAVVASGPTVPPPPSEAGPAELLDRYSIGGRAADLIRASDRPAAPSVQEPPAAHRALILADGFTAGRAAARHLSEAGLEAVLDPVPLAGQAREAVRRALAATPEGTARVLVGETTVEVTGRGRGGRNQHAALAAAIEIAGTSHRFLAFGTDGIDGPTDAAGGCVDGATVNDPAPARRHLNECDSYPYLEQAGALLRTGRTGTNVADLWIVDKSG